MDRCGEIAQSYLVLVCSPDRVCRTAWSRRLAPQLNTSSAFAGLLTALKPLLEEPPAQCDSSMLRPQEQGA